MNAENERADDEEDGAADAVRRVVGGQQAEEHESQHGEGGERLELPGQERGRALLHGGGDLLHLLGALVGRQHLVAQRHREAQRHEGDGRDDHDVVGLAPDRASCSPLAARVSPDIRPPRRGCDRPRRGSTRTRECARGVAPAAPRQPCNGEVDPARGGVYAGGTGATNPPRAPGGRRDVRDVSGRDGPRHADHEALPSDCSTATSSTRPLITARPTLGERRPGPGRGLRPRPGRAGRGRSPSGPSPLRGLVGHRDRGRPRASSTSVTVTGSVRAVP